MTDTISGTAGFRRFRIELDGIETVVFETGPQDSNTPTLVYYHGGGTFHGFEWVRPLADEFRLICPHHPNFGDSGAAPFTGMADYVAHYERMFDHMGLGRVHLCGASMGGHMAARHAVEAPARIDRLALVSPAGLASDKAAVPDWRQITPEGMRKMFAADLDWLEAHWPAEPSEEWRVLREREMNANMQVREDPAVTDLILRAGLKHFDRPVLLLWGDADMVVPLDFAEEWQEAIPHAKLVVIPTGAHLLLDEFTDAVTALRNFLEA